MRGREYAKMRGDLRIAYFGVHEYLQRRSGTCISRSA
jgi:hypothetical protein